jgi:hypothetical protein
VTPITVAAGTTTVTTALQAVGTIAGVLISLAIAVSIPRALRRRARREADRREEERASQLGGGATPTPGVVIAPSLAEYSDHGAPRPATAEDDAVAQFAVRPWQFQTRMISWLAIGLAGTGAVVIASAWSDPDGGDTAQWVVGPLLAALGAWLGWAALGATRFAILGLGPQLLVRPMRGRARTVRPDDIAGLVCASERSGAIRAVGRSDPGPRTLFQADPSWQDYVKLLAWLHYFRPDLEIPEASRPRAPQRPGPNRPPGR